MRSDFVFLHELGKTIAGPYLTKLDESGLPL